MSNEVDLKLKLESAYRDNNNDMFLDVVASLVSCIGVDGVISYAYCIAKEGKDEELFERLMNSLDGREFIDLFYEVVQKEIESEKTGKAFSIMKKYIIDNREKKSAYFYLANGLIDVVTDDNRKREVSLLFYACSKYRFDVAKYLFDLDAYNMTYIEVVSIVEKFFDYDDKENKEKCMDFLKCYVNKIFSDKKEELVKSVLNWGFKTQELDSYDKLEKMLNTVNFFLDDFVKALMLAFSVSNRGRITSVLVGYVKDKLDSNYKKELVKTVINLEIVNKDLDAKEIKSVLNTVNIYLDDIVKVLVLVLSVSDGRKVAGLLEDYAKNEFTRSQKEELVRGLIKLELENKDLELENKDLKSENKDLESENEDLEIKKIADLKIKKIEDRLITAAVILKDRTANAILEEELETLMRLELGNEDLDIKKLKIILKIANNLLEDGGLKRIVDLDIDGCTIFDIFCEKYESIKEDTRKNELEEIIIFLIENGVCRNKRCSDEKIKTSFLRKSSESSNSIAHEKVKKRRWIESYIEFEIYVKDTKSLSEYLEKYLQFCGIDCNNINDVPGIVGRLSYEELCKLRTELHSRGKYILNLNQRLKNASLSEERFNIKSIEKSINGSKCIVYTDPEKANKKLEEIEEERRREKISNDELTKLETIRSLIGEKNEKLIYVHDVVRGEFKKRKIEDKYNEDIKEHNMQRELLKNMRNEKKNESKSFFKFF